MSSKDQIALRVEELSTDDPQNEELNALNNSFNSLSTKYGFLRQMMVLQKMLNAVLDKAEEGKLLADPLMDVLEDAEDVIGYILFKAKKNQIKGKTDDDTDWSTAQKVATYVYTSSFGEIRQDLPPDVYADVDGNNRMH